MKRSVRNLLIAEAMVGAGILVIGSAAGWTASDYTIALVVVFGVALFATVATLGRSGARSSGGAMTDPIGRGSVRGTPAGAMSGQFEMVSDDDASREPYLPPEPTPDRRGFPLVPAGVAVATGIAALISRLLFE